jgi:hypothetical protein
MSNANNFGLDIKSQIIFISLYNNNYTQFYINLLSYYV